MTKTAYVKEILPSGDALVEVRRGTACAHDCRSCGGCGPQDRTARLDVKAHNPVGARVGDVVTLFTDTGRVLRYSALVYLGPMVLFFLGYLVSALYGSVSPGFYGAAGFVLGIFSCVWVNRRAERRGAPVARIVFVESRRSDERFPEDACSVT